MKLASRLSLVAVVLLSWMAQPSQAGPLTITSGTGLTGHGHYTGTLEYTGIDDASAVLTITLHNTTSPDQGGFLTHFAFNNPGNKFTGVTLDAAPAGFGLLGLPPFQNSLPFQNWVAAFPLGYFDIGTGVGTNWESGDNASNGIPAGGSATFAFSLHGTNLDKLTSSSFLAGLDTWSVPIHEFDTYQFAVRFHIGDATDKVPGALSDSGGGVTITGGHAPEPASLTLACIGIGGLIVRGWRGRQRYRVGSG